MNIDELFNTNPEDEKPIQMTSKEFIEKTRAILTAINRHYSQAVGWRRLTEEEYEQNDCDNCKGGCTIKVADRLLDCKLDYSEGDCFVFNFNYETFVEEIENIMFHDDNYSFYELLQTEITDAVS